MASQSAFQLPILCPNWSSHLPLGLISCRLALLLWNLTIIQQLFGQPHFLLLQEFSVLYEPSLTPPYYILLFSGPPRVVLQRKSPLGSFTEPNPCHGITTPWASIRYEFLLETDFCILHFVNKEGAIYRIWKAMMDHSVAQ